MTVFPFTIRLEQPEDDAAIENLHAVSFGPGRFARAAFRVREGVPHDPALSFVATFDGRLIGSVRLTPVRIGAVPAMFLGPLAVLPQHKGQGAGRSLLRQSVDCAAETGSEFVLLVGDEPYYGPFGFRPVPSGSIRFPGPVDPARVLLSDLRKDAAPLPAGIVTARAR